MRKLTAVQCPQKDLKEGTKQLERSFTNISPARGIGTNQSVLNL